jgi:hypothetical protein
MLAVPSLSTTTDRIHLHRQSQIRAVGPPGAVLQGTHRLPTSPTNVQWATAPYLRISDQLPWDSETCDRLNRDEMACECQDERQEQPDSDNHGCCPGEDDEPPEPPGANLIDGFTTLQHHNCATAQGGEVSAPTTGHGS